MRCGRGFFGRLIALAIIGILALMILPGLFFRTGMGYGYGAGFRNHMIGGPMNMNMGYGFGFNGTLTVFMMFLIKVLFFLFMVGLVVGIGVFIKNHIFTEEDVRKIKGTFSVKPQVVAKEKCSECGKELQSEWKLCPYCGGNTKSENQEVVV